MGSGEVPFAVRLLGKVVLEVLPAALASVIGAFLFAHYQFDRSAAAPAAAAPAMAAAPASTQMLALVREEHAMIRDYLIAQRAAEERRAAADDAADVRVAAAARMPAAPVRPATTVAALRPAAARKPVNIAAALAAVPTAAETLPPAAQPAATGLPPAATALPPVVVAGVAPDTGPMPPAPIGPAEESSESQQSLVGRTLALPGHVVAVTLHAVMAIGGIPSWIGHRFGAANLDSAEPESGTAS
jgi:hypothetical protein